MFIQHELADSTSNPPRGFNVNDTNATIYITSREIWLGHCILRLLNRRSELISFGNIVMFILQNDFDKLTTLWAKLASIIRAWMNSYIRVKQ